MTYTSGTPSLVDLRAANGRTISTRLYAPQFAGPQVLLCCARAQASDQARERQSARKVLDPTLPSNELLLSWVAPTGDSLYVVNANES